MRTLSVLRTVSMSCLVAVLSVVGPPARANPIPTTTDEARALAGRNLPRETVQLPPAKAYVIVSSTDEARSLAGSIIAAQEYQSAYSVVLPVSTTDEARAACRALDRTFMASEAKK